jgi:hypothetical protein
MLQPYELIHDLLRQNPPLAFNFSPYQFPFLNIISFNPPHSSTIQILPRTLANFLAAIAGQYGQGVTGKAVSERIVRMKREESWNLNNNNNRATGGAGDGSAKSTPRKRTPSKKKVEQYTGSNEDDDEDFNFSTPSKTKTPLNKVKNGRVVKKQQKDDRNMLSSFTDIDNDDDEVQIVKKEAKPQMSFNGMENGQGFSRGFGHSYVEDQDEDQDIYEDADEA